MTDTRPTVPAAGDPALQCLHSPPERRVSGRAIALVLVVTVAYMGVEVIGGLAANSLALLADAGHMFADVGALALALFAAWFAKRPATPEKTYGYLRLEILAALVNGAALMVVAGLIVRDAVHRLTAPPAVDPTILIGVASVGLVVNLFGAWMLHGGHRESLNVRGAYLHVLGDLLGSLGALGAGVIIVVSGWVVADPLISIGIALLILVGAWRLVRDSTDVLLEATPRHIRLGDVERSIATIGGVDEVHDLHVWTLTSGVVAMSGHAVVVDPGQGQRVLETAQARLSDLGIRHVTLQIEREHTCRPTV
ncbi:MAG: cation diffusion facilitator family transporter [Gemmatimonadota bacterium]|nr:cation diffusion facilitator family transporter [Gemmatimonadota bacterium]MDH3366465.1 cation diffusion facilitator family transporter [Gemmatimonadota bacterium]MDH3479096.1 cation diffusion facilitator family transporter [Gemmatimonadota bacterium]MDH3571944.1 cation diffusion facilitator family transporter [Gemmatimonadota bacterium]MDH5549207.1 cation diffusion facilitator family transporter [Gemmatimonadota bacterium]